MQGQKHLRSNRVFLKGQEIQNESLPDIKIDPASIHQPQCSVLHLRRRKDGNGTLFVAWQNDEEKLYEALQNERNR
jgi:hypothetical protein